ncbi:hypothetical protein DE146DRAFT_236761 [Phaeosphaeria sp. MPI-PUGE-AT-0046c]|nr:hypothetical protein DE146DRAFT_236761 [Phaeosphaeria sp. MPI-PUGE-AT-0046c]
MNNNTLLNPAATNYTPAALLTDSATEQLHTPPSPYLEARLLNLEEEHLSLRQDLDSLNELYHKLSSTFNSRKRDSKPFNFTEEQDPTTSFQSAVQLQQELQSLSKEAHKLTMSNINGSLPHLHTARGASNGTATKSVPPHLRGTARNGTKEPNPSVSTNNPLVTDGPVDTANKAGGPTAIPSPPCSPVTVLHKEPAMENLSLMSWQPYYLTTLAPYAGASKIPETGKMITFHPQFLDEHLGGSEWSPGMKYVMGNSTCMLKNRTYFVLSSAIDPYLPKYPGQHGAKLVPFFNRAPEDVHDNLPDDVSSSENVPVFVEQHGRYVYFGNYSQTRWSDRVGLDTMMAKVPEDVKEYWAKELTSPLRPDWVTEALKLHFFKKPDYEGRVHASGDTNDNTISSEEEVKLTEKMAKDVNKYVEELREWDREATMKTSLIKKQAILDAFDAADAEDPPALRFWWEYLECVDWRRDFYDLLVTLQSRQERYSK